MIYFINFAKKHLLVTYMIMVIAVPVVGAEGIGYETVEVVLQTQKGDIVLELYPQQAPLTVTNFLAYVDGDHFDGKSFYRLVRKDNDNGDPIIEVIQGGTRVAKEEPFPPIAHEDTDMTGIKHLDGTISMARIEPGTATGAFFICIGDQPSLDKGGTRNKDLQGFAAFGRVIEGMDVVQQIHQLESDATTDNPYYNGQIPKQPVVIKEARRR